MLFNILLLQTYFQNFVLLPNIPKFFSPTLKTVILFGACYESSECDWASIREESHEFFLPELKDWRVWLNKIGAKNYFTHIIQNFRIQLTFKNSIIFRIGSLKKYIKLYEKYWWDYMNSWSNYSMSFEKKNTVFNQFLSIYASLNFNKHFF